MTLENDVLKAEEKRKLTEKRDVFFNDEKVWKNNIIGLSQAVSQWAKEILDDFNLSSKSEKEIPEFLLYKNRVIPQLSFIANTIVHETKRRIAASGRIIEKYIEHHHEIAAPIVAETKKMMMEINAAEANTKVFVTVYNLLEGQSKKIKRSFYEEHKEENLEKVKEATLTSAKIACHYIGEYTGFHTAIYIEWFEITARLFLMEGSSTLNKPLALKRAMDRIEFSVDALQSAAAAIYSIPDATKGWKGAPEFKLNEQEDARSTLETHFAEYLADPMKYKAKLDASTV